MAENNNIVTILENFRVNRDAQATNQGFFYQYLVTLDIWLENYISKNDVSIYCETEDDIKVKDLKNEQVEFTQVKAYAKNFTLKSIEVQKSIINFFHLYVEYKDKNITPNFIFHTNTDFEGEFFKVSNGITQINSIEKEKCIKEIEKSLISEFKKKNKKKLEQLDKDIKTNTEEKKKLSQKKAIKDREDKIKKIEEDKDKISKEIQELKDFIKEKAPDFIDKIKWKAEKKDKESSINELAESIEKKISKIDGFKLDTDSAYAHLINKVLYASQAQSSQDRKLDNQMIDNLIKNAEDTDKFKKRLQSYELLPRFIKLYKQHNIQIKALDNIFSYLKDFREESQQNHNKTHADLKEIKEQIKPISNNDLKTVLKEKYKDFEILKPLNTDNKQKLQINTIPINLKLVTENEKEDKEEEFISIDKLIEKEKILIYGKAGIGKTTICKYIAYRWLTEEIFYAKFDFVIYIPLRFWESRGLEGAIKDYYYSEGEKRDIELFKDIGNTTLTLLFLFDGYDELNSRKKFVFQQEIKNIEHYIIVNRPYEYDKNDFKQIDITVEAIGLKNQDVERYIDNFFDKQNEKKSLNELLKYNYNLRDISHIPIMLEIICTLWEEKAQKDEEFSKSMTKTELYSEIIDSMLTKYAKRKNRDLHTCLQRKRIEKILGKLAFRGLKKQIILFNCDFVVKTIEDSEIDFFEQSVVKAGFLTPEYTPMEFLHLTFQEYFSALYISKLSKKKQKKIIEKYKFYPNIQESFAFLGGLIKNKEWFLDKIENEPRDLVGVYNSELLISVISEFRNYSFSIEKRKEIFQIFKVWFEAKEKEYFRQNFIPPIYLTQVKKIAYLFDKNFIDILIEPYIKSYKSTSILVQILIELAKVNDEIAYKLLDIIEDNNLENGDLRYNLSKTLYSIDIDETQFVDRAINIILDENIDKYNYWNKSIQESLAQSLYLFKLSHSHIKKLIDFLKKDKFIYPYDIYDNIKLAIVNSLLKIKEPNNKDIELISTILEIKNLNINIRGHIATYLIKKNKADNKIDVLKEISKELKNENSFSNRIEIIRFLISKDIDENEKIFNSIVLDLINRKNISYNRQNIYLFFLDKNNNKLIQLFDKFIKTLPNDIQKEINSIKPKKRPTYTFPLDNKQTYNPPTLSDSIKQLTRKKLFDKNINNTLNSIFCSICEREFFELLLTILNEKNINNSIRVKILKYFISLKSEIKNIENMKRDKDKGINIKLLLDLNSNGNEILDTFFEILEKDNRELLSNIEFGDIQIIDNIRQKIFKILEYLVKVKTKKIIDLIKKDNINFRNDNRRGEKVSQDKILLYIASLKREDLVDTFLKIIKESRTTVVLEILKQLLLIESKQLYIINTLGQLNPKLYRYLFKELGIPILFKVYDNKVYKDKDILIDIFIYAKNKKYSIYYRKNKLHTIENGKEISTQRKVDETTLNEIKMLFKRENSND